MSDLLLGFSETYYIFLGSLLGTLLISLIVFARLRPWRSASKRKRIGARLFLFCWMMIAVFAVSEISFALFYDTTDSYQLVKSSERWNVRHVRYNNMRFRDSRTYSNKNLTGRTRISILGDSFAFGHGVAKIEDRMSERLAGMLEKNSPGKFEVYNLSLPGNDTQRETQVIRDLAKNGFETKVLLLAYCLNDIEKLLPDNREMMGLVIFDQPKNFFIKESYLLNFLYYRSYQYRSGPGRDYFSWLDKAFTGEIWGQHAKQLDDLREACAMNQYELKVVIFPFLHVMGENYTFRAAHKNLNEYFSRHQVPCLDLLETYIAHSNEKLVVNAYDAHPNERAHELAAEAIYKKFFEVR